MKQQNREGRKYPYIYGNINCESGTFNKVREPKEDAPLNVPGKYVSSFDPKNDLIYEIVLNSDDTASYEVSSLKVVHSIIGYSAMSMAEKETIEKLPGKWRQKEDGTIEIRLRYY